MPRARARHEDALPGRVRAPSGGVSRDAPAASRSACNCTPSYYGVVWDRAARKQREDAPVPRRDRGAQRPQGPRGRAQPRHGRSRSPGRGSPTRATQFVARGARGRRAQQVGPALPAARVEGPGVGRCARVPDELARRRLGDVTPRRRPAPGRRHDAGRRVGLARPERRQLAALALPLGAGPRARRPRPGGERAAAGDGCQAARSGRDASRVRRSCSPRSSPRTRCRGRWPATPRRASRRSASLDWRHIDLKLGAVELAADEEGRKPGGSWRVVPLVKPLRKRLRETWIAQGRPTRARSARRGSTARPGCSRSATSRSACTASGAQLGLEPIGLHESRHTAATWLDHAGVSPKVASTLMGHKTPEYQPGAASITLRRYTHTLPGELERARDLLDALPRSSEPGRREGQAG